MADAAMASTSVTTAATLSRRPRERTLDLADRLVALQRKAAGPPVRRERTAGVTSSNQTDALEPSSPSLARREKAAASTAGVAAVGGLGAALELNPQPLASTSTHVPQHHAPQPHAATLSIPPHSSRRRIPPRDHSPSDYDRRMPDDSPHRRLYNPNADPVPQRQYLHMQHREADAVSDVSSGHQQMTSRMKKPLPPTPGHPPAAPPRQLFDYRKDDPLRFSVLTRGAVPPKSHPGPPSGGYISASSTSVSDTQSLASSFSLTSGTTSSSASGPYSPATGSSKDLGGARLWLDQMKRMYRDITSLESKILAEGDVVGDDDVMMSDSRDLKVSAPRVLGSNEDEKWARLVAEHKNLVELDHAFLSFALKPQVPASLQGLPAKYGIPGRLWNHGFQRLLAALRRASTTSLAALEQLEGFIIYAYGFYTSLLEEEHLNQFRVLWIEALGDLSRYQMAVVGCLKQADAELRGVMAGAPNVSAPAAPEPDDFRNEDSPLPSIGVHAAAELEMEDDRELWRRTAREWYAKGIRDTPGQGRLHHHLGLVSADVEGEELRACYHFAKSLVANHPCDVARESILPLFSVPRQNARYAPSSSTASIFVLMQGMLFTRIQLDDFRPTLARLVERLELLGDEVKEEEWVVMACLNVSALLEFGRPEGVIRKVCGLSATGVLQSSARPGSSSTSRTARKRDDEAMQIDTAEDAMTLTVPMSALSTEPISTPMPEEEIPYTLQLALQLTFTLLSHALRNPSLSSSKHHPFRPAPLNPYITVILTFLVTLAKHSRALAMVERYVPWEELAVFLSEARKRTGDAAESKSWFGKGPLPEDWCMRGCEWVRRVYERGFWRPPTPGKSEKEGTILSEIDVLIPRPAGNMEETDGIVEDGDDDGGDATGDWSWGRWKRVRWAGDSLVKSVHGFELQSGGKVQVSGQLQAKIASWKEEKQREEEEDRRRRERVAWKGIDISMEDAQEQDDEDESDEDDSAEVRALKARRRYLLNLQHGSHVPTSLPSTFRRAPKRPHRAVSAKPVRPPLLVSPGYTTLVCDTNILLSSLPLVSDVIASQHWTVVVPLAVVTELDGIAKQDGELGRAAAEALAYLISSITAQSTSLKIQTSRGNYLRSLTVRTENHTFQDGGEDRNMDDLILKTALWQMDHFVDRSALLQAGPSPATITEKTSKVILLTFDRNLRLKARSRQLDAADEKDMAAIFSSNGR